MRIVFFCHSIASDWNHGNAHFLRGVVSELARAGHEVRIFEPLRSWSLENLLAEEGPASLLALPRAYPDLPSFAYDAHHPPLDFALDGADLAIVHEWNEPELVRRIGEHRKRHGRYRLLFHDTHHRSLPAPQAMSAYDLSHYDGVLAYGGAIRDLYLRRGWARRVWVWHEAADATRFRPLPAGAPEGDLVWIGNWGDEERSAELREFLLEPAAELRLRACAYGVRYPAHARAALAAAGVEYRGYLPNFEVPAVFARFRVTLHVPRRPYAGELPGVPTIRPFEALACGIPLVSAPWPDSDGLFTAGEDLLLARDGREMKERLRFLLENRDFAEALARRGRETILRRHTCAHRSGELIEIARELGLSPARPEPGRSEEGWLRA